MVEIENPLFRNFEPMLKIKMKKIKRDLNG